MSLNNDGFDTKRFIEEVRRRPCLWDSKSSDYADRPVKNKCWEELVDLFKEDNEELGNNEKERILSTLQKRWKGIRGCFTRELQRRRSKTGPGPRKNEYVHFKRLQFLRNVVTAKECDPLAVTVDSDDSQPDRQVAKRRKKNQTEQKPTSQRIIEDETQPTPTNESRDKCECSNQDEDRLFMLSLVNTLKRVPTATKMATKIKIMSILDEATSIAPAELETFTPYIFKVEEEQE